MTDEPVWMPAPVAEALTHLDGSELLDPERLDSATQYLDEQSTDVAGLLGLLEDHGYRDDNNVFAWHALKEKYDHARQALAEAGKPMPDDLREQLATFDTQYAETMQYAAETLNRLAVAAMRVVVMTMHFRPGQSAWPVWSEGGNSLLAARTVDGPQPASASARIADLMRQVSELDADGA